MGTISVILAAPGRTSLQPSKVMYVARPLVDGSSPNSKRSRVEVRPNLSFFDKEKVGTLHPHDDALVITLRIGGMM